MCALSLRCVHAFVFGVCVDFCVGVGVNVWMPVCGWFVVHFCLVCCSCGRLVVCCFFVAVCELLWTFVVSSGLTGVFLWHQSDFESRWTFGKLFSHSDVPHYNELLK